MAELSPIQEAYLAYFELLGVADAKKADEATAVDEATEAKQEAQHALDKAVAAAQKVRDEKQVKARTLHAAAVSDIDSALEKIKTATKDAEKAVTDFQAKTKEELGYAPSLPQGAPPASGVRRTVL